MFWTEELLHLAMYYQIAYVYYITGKGQFFIINFFVDVDGVVLNDVLQG